MAKKFKTSRVVTGTRRMSLPLTSRTMLPPSCLVRIRNARVMRGLRRLIRANMSADVHEKFAFKEEASLFRYCEGNLSFSSTNDDDYSYNRKKMSRDPMSHRIIEKRRRDRMNNCLADLSRLIPTEYLKKGRGRIEKTEIIEMAIRHMKHLHEELRNAKNSRYSENSDNSVPSPPEAPRDASTVVNDQPIIVEHFRLGYLECLSEAMHYLVDVQGYFAGDSLCVQMINHLHKHCDKILKGNTLNCPKKQMGEGSNASANLAVARPMSNSPVSSSTGVPSDDNLPSQNFESGAIVRSGQTSFRSPKRYSERSHHLSKKHLEVESRSDVELQQNFALKCRTSENLKEESAKNYLNPYVPGVNYDSGSYIQTGSISLVDESSYDNSSKEDSLNGPSQLREMLTATPAGHPSPLAKNGTDMKESTSPATSDSASPTHVGSHKSCPIPKNLSFKSHSATGGENHEGNPDIVEGSDNHHMMYKFKNNIKQRFSKENREIQDNDSGGELPAKRAKVDDCMKYQEPVDFDFKRRLRYASESDAIDVGDISNRLSFGHKSSDKLNKKWEEPVAGIHQQNSSKLWTFSPQPSTSFFNGQPAICGGKPLGRQSFDSSFNSVTVTASEMTHGVPIFALHAKGSFYIPLTLDHASLAPFLTILGITKTDEETEQNTILHPVTISVNFQSQSSQSPPRSLNG